MDILGILIGLFLLVILVVIHELGHAIVARRNGVVVEEFGIGFPPRAWAKKLKNGILFSINWLPLGGFVKLQGENDAANKKGDYGAASLWAKTKILMAGVAVNWVFAAFIFSIIAIVGMPKVLNNQFTVPADTQEISQPVTISTVAKDSPAKEAGLEVGDEILRFDGQPVPNPESLTTLTKEHKGKEVEIIYKRGSQEETAQTKLNEENNGKGYLGVGSTQRTVTRSTWSAPIVGVGVAVQFTGATLDGLGNLVASLAKGTTSQLSSDEKVRKEGSEQINEAGNSVAGPIGILGVIFPAAKDAGLTSLLLLTGIISLTLAIMNALPIPALDGGRLFVTLLFRVMKKPLNKDMEEKIHGTGFAFLLLLIVVITVADVGKFFG